MDLQMELKRRMRPDELASMALQSQPGFYKNIHGLLRSRGITFEPPGVAGNASIATKVIQTIYRTAGTAITYYIEHSSSETL